MRAERRSDLRILLGPMKAENEAGIRHPELRLDDSFCFYDNDSGSYAEILAKLPHGWKPDVVIHWSLEYYSPPKGIDTAECLTAAVLGDWNLGGQAMHLMGGAFDVLIADRNGCERLRSAGFTNVIHAPLWSYDPKVHRVLPNIRRDIDILMIGNFNHEIQRERARWISRVLMLSDKYNVCITAGFFGEEYTQMMNRAKIVFNRSVRGEMNMRAYEAAACGALLFNERENSEIRDFFTDREECVLYGDDDLEYLLEYYLSHPEESESIAKAGSLAVLPYTMQHHTNHIYDLLQSELNTPKFESAKRQAYTLSETDREYNGLCHQLLTPVHHPFQIAEKLAALEGKTTDSAALHNAIGCAFSGLSGQDIDESFRVIFIDQAVACFKQSISMRPNYAVAWFNLAQLALKTNLPIAEEALEQTYKLLCESLVRPTQLIGPFYPGVWDALRTEMERVYGWFQPDSVDGCEEIRRLILWLTYEQLYDLNAGEEHWEIAYDYAHKAVEMRPDVFSSRMRLARAFCQLGYLEKACEQYRFSLQDLPLNPEAWTELAQILMILKQYDECHTFISERRIMLSGCPVYFWWREELEQMEQKLNECRTALPKSLTLLAQPDWNFPSSWQPLVRSYVRNFHSGDPILLILTSSPEKIDTVVSDLSRYLTSDLNISLEEIPDVQLVIHPVTEEDCRYLYNSADGFIKLSPQNDTPPSPIRTLSLDQLPEAIALLA